MRKFKAYTDGACWGGGIGPGAWAVLLRVFDEGRIVYEKNLCGGKFHTSVNRIEMWAAIKALESLDQPSDIEITTDSTYLFNGITKWINKWKKNGWITNDGDPVKNRDLWEWLDKARSRHHKVDCFMPPPGNDGIKRAHELANGHLDF